VPAHRSDQAADERSVVAATYAPHDAFEHRVLVVRRVVATLVDLVLALGVAALVGLALGRWLVPVDHEAADVWLVAGALGLAAAVLVPVLWFVVGESRFGATPGKALLGLRVVDTARGRLTPVAATRRLLYRSAFLGGLGVAGLVRSDRPWHDRWVGADVRSVRPIRRRRPARPPVPAAEVPVDDRVDTHEPAIEGPATDLPGTERPSSERPTTERRATEPPATERRATELPGTERPTTERPTTERPVGAIDCRCRELRQLSGDEAAAYANGHLLTVGRWPDVGRFALVCPVTRLTWMAHDAWATEQGETTLVRVAGGVEAPSTAASRV
jgi:uncharacterized RDD family membrane protein YckC